MKLVADANVLLSAVLGGRAKVVLDHPSVTEVQTAAATMAEVQEYAPILAAKKRLPLDIVLMAVTTLPVTVIAKEVYETSLPEAKRRIGKRDPDDVDILALALHTQLPLWTNDKDFEEAGIERFTTAEILVALVGSI